MKVRDVMTTDVVTVSPETPFKEIVERMLTRGISGLPVVDAEGRVVGLVTEADLVSKEAYAGRRAGVLSLVVEGLAGWDTRWLAKSQAMTAAELMTKLVLSVSPGEDLHAAARTMLQQRVKRLPVVDDGRLVGILSRVDLLKVFDRRDSDIAADVTSLLSDPWLAPDDHDAGFVVADGVVTLTGTVLHPSDVEVIERLIGKVPGVVKIESQLAAREPEPRHRAAAF